MFNKRLVCMVCLIMLITVLFIPSESTMAQGSGIFDVTFGTLGYEDTVAYGPSNKSYYSLSLPAGWEILDGGSLTLDLDYRIFTNDPRAFAHAFLEVRFNERVLRTEQLTTPSAKQLRVDLPAKYFRPFEDPEPNLIRLWFSEEHDCEVDLETRLTIKNTSSLHIAYRERPLPLDLALFPKPIYNGAVFEQSSVQFVLPADYDAIDLQASAIIAARLGQLTGHRLPISVTLASKTSPFVVTRDDIIAIGKLEKNPLIAQLAKPMSLNGRRLSLHSQMPAMASAGSVYSYTLFVENTSSNSETLTVEDSLEPGAVFQKCAATCSPITAQTIRWNIGPLAAGQQTSTTVTLQVTPVVSSNISLRHTATLYDARRNILNVDTLAIPIGDRYDSRLVQSAQKKSSPFLVQNGQAVAEDAGILQEIISPWNARRIAVIVTGQDNDALLKAAHGLNSQYHFPGLKGQSAIVEDTRPITIATSTPLRNVTLAALGYSNRELNAVDAEVTEYVIDLPPDVSGDDSYVALHIAHAATLTTARGALKVSLNGTPIGSVRLDDSNLSDAWVRIPLSKAAIKPGRNRIRVQPTVDILPRCLIRQLNSYWVAVYADSILRFEYKPIKANLDLRDFPYPYDWPRDMGQLVFALSDTPNRADIEGMLRIASLIGSRSSSEDFAPRIVFGPDINQPLLSQAQIIAIGLPQTNSIIRRVNSSLPQPFIPNTSLIYQSIDRPIYGIAPGTDLGIVEQIASPWSIDNTKALLVIAGTTAKGLEWATAALASPRAELRGNLVLIRDNQVYSTDTRPITTSDIFTPTIQPTSTLSVSPTAVPTPTPTPRQVSQPLPTVVPPVRGGGVSEQPAQPSPIWLVPLVVISALALIGLVVWEVWRRRP